MLSQLLKQVLGQFVARVDHKRCGQFFFGRVLAAGHGVLITEHEMSFGFLGVILHETLQSPELIGIGFDVVVVRVQRRPMIGGLSASAAWASRAAPRYSFMANNVSEMNS